jgi:1-acyl-sn-glycerol-3-phosphate acyltransferase
MTFLIRLLYQPYMWLVFIPLFILSTVFFVTLGTVIVALFGPTAANRTTGVWWSRFNSFITPIRVDVFGRDNVDPGQSYIVVSNHQSLYDIFVLYGWLGIDIRWVMKVELRKIPVFGYAGERGGNIYIDRSNPVAAVDSLKRARAVLSDGISVIMLPEGTRSRTGRLQEFKKGAFVLAMDLGVPILPITIFGTNRILPPKTLNLLPGRARIIIHPPIDAAHYQREEIDELIARTKAVIQSGLDRFS